MVIDTPKSELYIRSMKHLIIFLLLLSFTSAEAQVMADFAPSGQTRDGSIVFYGSEAFNKKIPYNTITGVPYWKNDYYPAFLYGPGGRKYGLTWIRVNLATNEIEFLAKNDEVQAAYPNEVARAVVVDPMDSSKILTIFRNDVGEVNVNYMKEGKLPYVQEMNPGPVKLLKVTHRELKVGDSMLRTMKRFYFADRFDYYLQQGNRVQKLKKLEKDEILKFLPDTPELQDYLSKNKVVFKKEEEVIRLLGVYRQNSQTQ
jgi:hypothetical protein